MKRGWRCHKCLQQDIKKEKWGIKYRKDGREERTEAKKNETAVLTAILNKEMNG